MPTSFAQVGVCVHPTKNIKYLIRISLMNFVRILFNEFSICLLQSRILRGPEIALSGKYMPTMRFFVKPLSLGFQRAVLLVVGVSLLLEDLSSIVYWLAHTEGVHRASFYKILDQVVRANGLYEPSSKNDVKYNKATERSATLKQFAWTETKGTLKWWTKILMAGPYNPLRVPKPFNPLVEEPVIRGRYVARSSSITKLLSATSVSPLSSRTAWESLPITGPSAAAIGQDQTEIVCEPDSVSEGHPVAEALEPTEDSHGLVDTGNGNCGGQERFSISSDMGETIVLSGCKQGL